MIIDIVCHKCGSHESLDFTSSVKDDVVFQCSNCRFILFEITAEIEN